MIQLFNQPVEKVSDFRLRVAQRILKPQPGVMVLEQQPDGRAHEFLVAADDWNALDSRTGRQIKVGRYENSLHTVLAVGPPVTELEDPEPHLRFLGMRHSEFPVLHERPGDLVVLSVHPQASMAFKPFISGPDEDDPTLRFVSRETVRFIGRTARNVEQFRIPKNGGFTPSRMTAVPVPVPITTRIMARLLTDDPMSIAASSGKLLIKRHSPNESRAGIIMPDLVKYANGKAMVLSVHPNDQHGLKIGDVIAYDVGNQQYLGGTLGIVPSVVSIDQFAVLGVIGHIDIDEDAARQEFFADDLPALKTL